MKKKTLLHTQRRTVMEDNCKLLSCSSPIVVQSVLVHAIMSFPPLRVKKPKNTLNGNLEDYQTDVTVQISMHRLLHICIFILSHETDVGFLSC